MKRLGLVGAVAASIAIASCGSSTPPPSTSDPGSSGERISGNERLGWSQSANDGRELATFRYAAYVDGNRTELADVSCSASTGGAFPCSSRMPGMTAGSHTLELVSFVVDGDSVVESQRSAALRVTLTGSTAGGPPANGGTPAALLKTADGIELRLDVLSDQLQAPTALAVGSDGRVFVAEQEGRIRVVSNGVLDPQPALIIHEVLPTSAGEGGLVALALDAQFDRTHFVYAAYTVAGAEASRRFRVVRFREVNGRLGERVVLLDDIPTGSQPAAALATGPDGRLYVAFEGSPGAGRTPAVASYNGKVLRLNVDGTTPQDQPSGMPVFAADVHAPRGLDWHPALGTFWIADTVRRDADELRVLAAEGGHMRARLPLPAGTGAAGLAFYRGTLLPAFAGNILVAAEEGRALLRLRLDPRDPARIVAAERLLQDQNAAMRAVATSTDGLIYVATERALLRVGPK
jgi:glucose/arabinose dehydrogenase